MNNKKKMQSNRIIFTLILQLILQNTNYVFSLIIPLINNKDNCCLPVWAEGPLKLRDVYPWGSRLICNNYNCLYKTCGESDYIDNIFYNKTLPMIWSKSEHSFIIGNSYCGVGSCNLNGCNCDDGCKVPDLKQNPLIKCMTGYTQTDCGKN